MMAREHFTVAANEEGSIFSKAVPSLEKIYQKHANDILNTNASEQLNKC